MRFGEWSERANDVPKLKNHAANAGELFFVDYNFERVTYGLKLNSFRAASKFSRHRRNDAITRCCR
jgi:hypothetical protein